MIRFLYRNKLIAKKFYEEKGEYDVGFKSNAFSAFLIFINIAALDLLISIFFPVYRDLSIFNDKWIRSDIVYMLVVAFFFVFMCFLNGKSGWDDLSKKDRVINKIYIVWSLLSLPIVYFIYYFK